MSTDDPIDGLVRSISDGQPVDWQRVESEQPEKDRARLRALRRLEQVASHYRQWQRSSSDAREPVLGATGLTVQPGPWGDLTILELASAGANGEVWRAWDNELQRDVALKFLLQSDATTDLPPAEAALLDEARALARVRHPGVVSVYGIGAHGGRVGMWMELLRGHTLEAEIERRDALPPREVAGIGLALCKALEAVESAGLVHRDIKPANVVLEPGGRIVLTDFGLGRRRALGNSVWRASGTPLFMSPDLLEGQPATPRSDIYALGVTLRWALTGRSPFQARTIEELKLEAARGPLVPLAKERPDAPAALVDAIEQAMRTAPNERPGSATSLAALFETAIRSMDAGPARRKRLVSGLAIGFGLAAVLGATAILAPRLSRSHPKPGRYQFSIPSPPTTVLIANALDVVVSPDGSTVAFVAIDSVGTHRLWLRPLDAAESHVLEGTEDARQPFWSPDSRFLGFGTQGKLAKVAVTGGRPQILCESHDPRGATWGKSNVIVFAPVPVGPLCRISAEGGPVTVIQTPDSSLHQTALRWPQFLPDGQHFTFVSLPSHAGNFDVFVASIESPGKRQLIATAGAAPVCAGDEGLVTARNGRLMVQRFDYERLRPLGEPVSLGPASSTDESVGQPLASTSLNGVLVQPTASLANTELVWLDRSGRRTGTLEAPVGRYEKMFFSPDARRVLAARRTSPTDVTLWLIEPERRLATRFTWGSQTRIGGRPVWSSDGSRIAFSSNRSGPSNIYECSLNGAGEEAPLYESSGEFKEVDSWSPDGRYLVFEQADPTTRWDLWLLPLEGERKPIPYLRTKFDEFAASISPDGHWMSYASEVTGRLEVYVRSFPTPGREILVTSAGGVRSHWSQDGKELLVFNENLDNAVWAIPVVTSPTFKAGTPKLLFRSAPEDLWVTTTPAGDRFLESRPARDVEPATVAVDVNWPLAIR